MFEFLLVCLFYHYYYTNYIKFWINVSFCIGEYYFTKIPIHWSRENKIIKDHFWHNACETYRICLGVPLSHFRKSVTSLASYYSNLQLPCPSTGCIAPTAESFQEFQAQLSHRHPEFSPKLYPIMCYWF